MKDLQKQYNDLQEKIKNEAIDKIMLLIRNYADKTSYKNYEATAHELLTIDKMIDLLNYIKDNNL